MTHYVCLGTCHSVLKQPAACADELCPMYGKPLQECNCTNEGHREALRKLEDEEKEDETE